MLNAVLVGLVISVLLMAGIAAMPEHATAADALTGLGLALIDLGTALGQILQLPVTVPLYLIDHPTSFAAAQQHALHDRGLWTVALSVWAIVALLARTSSARPA